MRMPMAVQQLEMVAAHAPWKKRNASRVSTSGTNPVLTETTVNIQTEASKTRRSPHRLPKRPPMVLKITCPKA